jgi:hypothetical protein
MIMAGSRSAVSKIDVVKLGVVYLRVEVVLITGAARPAWAVFSAAGLAGAILIAAFFVVVLELVLERHPRTVAIGDKDLAQLAPEAVVGFFPDVSTFGHW